MTNFYLRDPKARTTAINAHVFILGKLVKFSTKISIPPGQWNATRQRAKVNISFLEGKEINKKLDQLQEIIDKNALKYQLSGEIPTPQDLVKKPQAANITFIDFLNEIIKNPRLAQSTRQKYTSTINKLTKYQQHTGKILYFEDINHKFYNDLNAWFYSQTDEKREGLPYSLNYYGSIIKNIKSAMNQARENKLTQADGHKHSHFITQQETSETIYLSMEELGRIHQLELTPEALAPHFPKIRKQNLNNKIRSYEIVRARFLIGAFTALRISDFRKLDATAFSRDRIRLKTGKTGATVIIPIHPILAQVLQNFDLNKTVSEQHINRHIKIICKIAGITEPVTITRTHGNLTRSFTTPKYKLVTTHTARRSAATNMYKAGIPSISIMMITGHKKESTFLKYIKVTQEENADLIAKHQFFNS